MEIQYRIKGLKESGFVYKPDFDYSRVKADAVLFQFSHEFTAHPEEKELALTMDAYVVEPLTNVVLAQQSVYCTFEIIPFDKVIQISDSGFKTNSPLLVDTFISVAIGALRGLLSKNLSGTPLQGVVLPLIPMDVIRENSAKMLTAEG